MTALLPVTQLTAGTDLDGPEIVDLVSGSTTEIPSGARHLFDDQDVQQYHPPPRPPSENFYRLDPRLQSLGTKIVIIGIPRPPLGDRLQWDLWGPNKGRQGLELAPNLSGLMHVPFQHLMSEGPYMVGAFPERVDWRKREISMAVMVNVAHGLDPDNSFRYRMLEERWWSSLSATEDAFVGVFTRTHGWRFVKVRLAEDPKTPFNYDPVGHDDAFMQWDVTLVAPQPYWHKRKLVSGWQNTAEVGGFIPGTPWNEIDQLVKDLLFGLIPDRLHNFLLPGLDIGEGYIRVANRGSEAAFPLFIVTPPGRAWIQDGPGGAMIELPLMNPADGLVLIDTDPMKRTATAAADAVDPLYYRLIRQSQFLDFILHDVTSATLPVWRRMRGRFSVPWPAKQVANIKVQHSNPNGSIVCLMPQKFGMAYA